MKTQVITALVLVGVLGTAGAAMATDIIPFPSSTSTQTGAPTGTPTEDPTMTPTSYPSDGPTATPTPEPTMSDDPNEPESTNNYEQGDNEQGDHQKHESKDAHDEGKHAGGASTPDPEYTESPTMGETDSHSGDGSKD